MLKKYIINNNGIEQVKAVLLKHHKRGADIVSNVGMVRAWAADAERSLEDSAQAGFEIRGWNTLSGRTECITITIDAFDAVDFFEEGE